MSQNKTNFAVPLAFVGMMFFAIGFALGINSFLIPVLKGALSLPSGVAYLLLAATFVPFLIFGYPASATIAKIGVNRGQLYGFYMCSKWVHNPQWLDFPTYPNLLDHHEQTIPGMDQENTFQ